MTAAAEEVTKQLEGNRDESCSKTMPPNEATPATAAAATANAEASNANNGGSDESGKMVEGGGGGGAKVAFTAASDTKLEIGTVDEGGGSGKKAKQGLYIYQKYLHKQAKSRNLVAFKYCTFNIQYGATGGLNSYQKLMCTLPR
jgi:membrane protein involved in colicin uptake